MKEPRSALRASVRQGDNAASGFLFDTWRLFEDFVSDSLQTSLSRRGVRVELQLSSYLDQGCQLVIKPENVVRSSGSVIADIDAKVQSREERALPSRRCLSDAGLLFEVRSERGPPRVRKRRGGRKVICY